MNQLYFGGWGTSIAVAQKFNRNWVGVDISHLAIRLILKRLTEPYDKPLQDIIKEKKDKNR